MKVKEPENVKYIAHIINNKVVNVSVWDNETDWSPSEEIVEIPMSEFIDKNGKKTYFPTAGIGSSYVDGKFIDERPSYEELTKIEES